MCYIIKVFERGVFCHRKLEFYYSVIVTLFVTVNWYETGVLFLLYCQYVNSSVTQVTQSAIVFSQRHRSTKEGCLTTVNKPRKKKCWCRVKMKWSQKEKCCTNGSTKLLRYCTVSSNSAHKLLYSFECTAGQRLLAWKFNDSYSP